MKYFATIITSLLFAITLSAQFQPVEKEQLTIIVTDGTDAGKRSEVVQTPKGVGPGGAANKLEFTDPIRPLGMSHAIQAAAFLERPIYGRAGFLLIFCVNDSIGDEQGTYETNGQTYKGVYRLIRQKFTPEEPIPEGMAPYMISGTVFILGVS